MAAVKNKKKSQTAGTGGVLTRLSEEIHNPPGDRKPDRYDPALPLAMISESLTNPRKVFKDLDDLAVNIREIGVQQAILVRPKGNEFELVCGARRFRASKLAGISTIPASIRDLDDREVLIIQVAENDQRKDVEPMDQARGYRAMVDAGMSIEEISAKVARPVSYVRQRLELSKLLPVFVKKLENGQIGFSHAMLLCRLQPDDQREFASGWEFQEGRCPSVAELKQDIQNQVYKDLNKAAFPKDDANLVARVGPCTTCQKRTGYNTALFQDIQKADTCTDHQCFKTKQQAYVNLQIKRNVGAVKVSTDHYTGDKDFLGTSDYEKVSAADAKKLPANEVKTAVVVHGDDVGKTFLVRVGKRKPSASSNSVSSEDKARQKREKEFKQLKNTILERIVASADKLKNPAGQRLIAHGILEYFRSDCCKTMAKRHGWQPKRKNDYGWESREIESLIDECPDEQLHAVIVELILNRTVQVFSYSELKMDPLLKQMAEACGVSIDQVKKDLAAGERQTAAAPAPAGKKAVKGRKSDKPAPIALTDTTWDLIRDLDDSVASAAMQKFGATVNDILKALQEAEENQKTDPIMDLPGIKPSLAAQIHDRLNPYKDIYIPF